MLLETKVSCLVVNDLGVGVRCGARRLEGEMLNEIRPYFILELSEQAKTTALNRKLLQIRAQKAKRASREANPLQFNRYVLLHQQLPRRDSNPRPGD